MAAVKPSDLEMQILSVLWENGPSTVRDVLKSMPDGKERAYTSVLSVMQVMEKKGLLKHSRKGTAHIYRPAVEKKKIMRPFIRRLVDEVFGGRPAAMMQTLLSETQISENDLVQVRQLLKGIDKQNRGKGGTK